MIRVLVVDDHAIVRKGITQIIRETPDIVVTDEAETGQEALKKIFANDYDLVLLDISLPGVDGLEIMKQLKSLRPNLPVLMLSMYPEEQYALQALRLGAAGYLTKETAPDELVAAIRRVSAGGKFISSELAESLAAQIDRDNPNRLPHELLSDREYQIMGMLAAGKKQTQIAQELALSIKTVGTYRARILKKMRMKSTAELTRYAIEMKII